MKKQYVMAMLLGCLSVASAFAQNVAIVNGVPVPSARVDALADQIKTRSGGAALPDDVKGQLKEEVITREVLAQEAKRRGLGTTPAFQEQANLLTQALLINELFNDFKKQNPVTDAEIQAEYKRFIAENGGKEYRASHILVSSEAEAKAIIVQLKKGAKFDQLARKKSKDPGSAQHGGDLDWANPNSYVKEFSDALLKLKKGEITSEPVKTNFGYHIIRLDDVREAKLPTLEEIKPQIEQELQRQKIAKFQKDLRDAAKVE